MVMDGEFGVASAGAVCPWLTSGNVAFSRDIDRRAEESSFMATFLVFVRLQFPRGFRSVLSFKMSALPLRRLCCHKPHAQIEPRWLTLKTAVHIQSATP